MLHFLKGFFIIASLASMCICIIIFIVRLWTEWMCMWSTRSLVIQTASHIHTQLFHFLIVLFCLCDHPLLVPLFSFLLNFLHTAPYHQCALFYLEPQVELHVPPMGVVWVFASDVFQRWLAPVEIAVFQEIFFDGFGFGDEFVSFRISKNYR